MSHSAMRLILILTLLASGSALFAAEPATEFKQRCSQCHGVDAKGNTTIGKSLKIPDLTGPEVAKVSDDELVQVISEGRGSMPSFKGVLDQSTIKQVISYIRSLQKAARK